MLRAPIWTTSIEQLRDDRQTRLLAGFPQHLEGVEPQALEGVRRRARLESAAAEHRRPRLRHCPCRLQRLLAVLDRAGTGDEPEVAVADPPAANLDHSRIGRELARDELVGLQDRQHPFDARVPLEGQPRQPVALADRADHGHLAAT
jgi:hypothetical protein